MRSRCRWREDLFPEGASCRDSVLHWLLRRGVFHFVACLQSFHTPCNAALTRWSNSFIAWFLRRGHNLPFTIPCQLLSFVVRQTSLSCSRVFYGWLMTFLAKTSFSYLMHIHIWSLVQWYLASKSNLTGEVSPIQQCATIFDVLHYIE